MPDLEDLLAALQRRNVDVVHARNEGNGSVPVHYVDDLTTAVTALLAKMQRPPMVGDVIAAPKPVRIHPDVLEFVDREGERWRRPVDEAEATFQGRRYDWARIGGGLSSTESRLSYGPLRITKVRGDEPAPRPVLPPARVGDLIGPNAEGIPDNVLEFVNEEGDTWRRPVDEAEATHEGQVYDWVTVGGWATTEGQVNYYTPLRVTKVRNDEV